VLSTTSSSKCTTNRQVYLTAVPRSSVVCIVEFDLRQPNRCQASANRSHHRDQGIVATAQSSHSPVCQLVVCTSTNTHWHVVCNCTADGGTRRLVNLNHVLPDTVTESDVKFRLLPAIIRLFKDTDPFIIEEAPLIFGMELYCNAEYSTMCCCSHSLMQNTNTRYWWSSSLD
jgi:hypothetical protein